MTSGSAGPLLCKMVSDKAGLAAPARDALALSLDERRLPRGIRRPRP